MKKTAAIILLFMCILSLSGCLLFPSDAVAYSTDEDGNRYLILPISKAEVRVMSHHEPHLTAIDPTLLQAAEETLTAEAARYDEPKEPWFSLTFDTDGHLCLSLEVIVQVPLETKTEEDTGEVETRHEHKILSERITP